MHRASLLICFAICCFGTLIYATAPTITSFTPSTGPIGTVVTVTGTNYSGVTSVKFNGLVSATITNISDTSLKATVPAGASTGKITVIASGGTTTSTTNFTVTHPPTINAITAQVMVADSVKTVNFSVQDVDSPANSLVVTATSSNTSLEQNAKILSTQTGNSRVLTITPEPGKFGSTTITVTVTDGGGLSASTSFLLTVNSSQPDISLRPSTVTSYTGVGVYNGDGTNQSVSQSVANALAAVYYIHMQNKGNVADTFKITGTKAPTGWTVVYKINNSLGADITADVTGAGWTTPVVNSNAMVTVAVYVTPGSTILAYAATNLKLTAVSVTNQAQQDVGMMTTSVVGVNRPDLSLRPSAVITYTGMGVYNLTGAKQTVSQSIAKGGKATYYIHVQNNGNISDTFTITGSAAPAGWTYDYKDFSTGTSITTAITGVGWSTPVLKPGALATLAVYAMPDATVSGSTVAAQKVTATSSANPAQQDVGMLQTKVVSAPTLTSFTPTFGSIGQIVTLTGTNFTGAMAVKFNGVSATFTVVDSTRITAAVVSGTSTGKITITTPGSMVTSTAVFTIISAGTPGTNPTDGAVLVWVPAGTFTMGNPDDIGDDDEHPAHQVTLSGYWIYKYEVTVAQYLAFCSATSRSLPLWPVGYSWAGKTGWSDPALQQHPIVGVTWYDAKAYADWAGVQLLTEAQWEYAARGPQGLNYPWGGTATAGDMYNGWDQTKCANYYNSYSVNKSTWPVGSFPSGVSWCGAQDLAGNALEWCADWYGSYSSSPVINPIGSTTGRYRVLRGGSYNDVVTRSAFRSYGNLDYRYGNVGFRCVSVLMTTSIVGVNRPDLSLRSSAVTTYSGMEVYNLTGANQTVSQSIAKSGKATYYIHVQNNGNVSDTFTITGSAAPAGWTYDYKDYSTGTSITTAMSGAGWSTPVLKPGALVTLTVYAMPDATIAGNGIATQTVTATSNANPVQQDVGVLQTTVVSAPTLTSFMPTFGPIGQVVTLTGTNLTGAMTVKFNGVSAAFTVVDSTKITATIASGTTTGIITVTTSGGTVTSTEVFTVTSAGTPGINPTDGADMVWVPGGSFTMGSPDGVGSSDQHPMHQVTLSGYWIYKYEVTVAQYRAFCSATSRALPPWPENHYSWSGKAGWSDPALQQHPIVDVSWFDAKAYADWAGVQLPTEAQWEYAARGPQGRNYPWGGTATATDPYNGWDQTKCANCYNSKSVNKSTWPVGSFPSGVSWCGAQDLAGNANEWCADWYGSYSSSPESNPTGPAVGTNRMWLCSSWNDNEFVARGAFRISVNPVGWNYLIGFRCSYSTPGP